MKPKRGLFSAILIIGMFLFIIGCAYAEDGQTTLYGKVTKINGTEITVALGTLKQQAGGQPQQAPPNSEGAPPMPGGGQASPPEILTLSGETKTFTVTNSCKITMQGMQGPGSAASAAKLSDIKVGAYLQMTFDSGAKNPSLIHIMLGSQPGGTPPAAPSGQTSVPGGQAASDTTIVAGTAVYALSSGTAKKSEGTLKATTDDQSAVIVSNGGSLAITSMQITTSGNTSSMDNSSFYGLNAALLVKAGSKLTIKDTDVTTTGTGANGIFACGSGSYIELNGVTIDCAASGAHGVDSTIGGKIVMENVDITTSGNGAAAAIATDRGGGTIIAKGGTVLTKGTKSPAIYSTGAIEVSNATLRSITSEVAVIEGKNSITLSDCIAKSEKNYGVFIYQSMSGDATVGSGTFTMSEGSLTVTEGPVFYSTNTACIINLKSVKISGSSGILLKAGADQWGNSGSNGADITLNADSQKLSGDVVLDGISTASLVLKNESILEGAINKEKTAKFVSLSLDGKSTWKVTADSYVTVMKDGDNSLANIISNGHNVYYDSKNKDNSWLSGKTITLVGGGKLMPAK